jgi:hypothetical protein
MNSNLKLLVQFLVTAQLFFFLGWLINLVVTTPTLESSVKDVITTVLYQIVPVATGAAGFWLGTSLSSQSKDHTISQVATKSAT